MCTADLPARGAAIPDAGLLRLVQMLSPAFPTGAYAYSHGLEWDIAAGGLRDGAGVVAWIGDILTHGAGWSDAVLLADGLRGGDLDTLAQIARALAPSAERLRETVEQGAAFAAAASALGHGHPPRPLPVAVAAVARDLALPPATVTALYLHAFAANLVSVAVRFVPLGQAEGQRMLAALHPVVLRLAQAAQAAGVADIASSTFRADMGAMAHETLDVRIFKT